MKFKALAGVLPVLILAGCVAEVPVKPSETANYASLDAFMNKRVAAYTLGERMGYGKYVWESMHALVDVPRDDLSVFCEGKGGEITHSFLPSSAQGKQMSQAGQDYVNYLQTKPRLNIPLMTNVGAANESQDAVHHFYSLAEGGDFLDYAMEGKSFGHYTCQAGGGSIWQADIIPIGYKIGSLGTPFLYFVMYTK